MELPEASGVLRKTETKAAIPSKRAPGHRIIRSERPYGRAGMALLGSWEGREALMDDRLNPTMGRRDLLRLLTAGAHPRMTRTAAHGIDYVRIRSGTDIPAIWGMLWHIFKN